MYYVSADYRKQSLGITTVLFVALMLLLLFLNFPLFKETTIVPLEGGGGGGDIEVNFGDSEVGQGVNLQNKEHVEEAAKAQPSKPQEQEALLTNDNDDDNAVAVTDTKKPKDEPKKPVEKPVEVVKPKPSAAALAALNAATNSKSTSGDGNDGQAGNKGKSNGLSTAGGYNGGGGSGTGSGGGNGSGQGIGTGSGYGSGNGGGRGSGNGNWSLAGRKLAKSSKVQQNCNESGTVVVQVTVNRNGDVVGTQYIKGTTNTAPCLIEPAYQTARSYKWNANPEAPEKQIGTVTINFSLGGQ